MNGRHRLTMKSHNTPEAVTSAHAAPSAFPQVWITKRSSPPSSSAVSPPSLIAVNACGMSLVHDQDGLVALGDCDQIFKRREVTVHTVEALHHDPDAPHSAPGAPVANRVFNRLGIIMGAYPKLGSARSSAFMKAGVHERIDNKQIAPLRHCCQNSEICDVTAAKEKRCLRPEELRRLRFESFVLLAIAAQEP
ncbi:hypothetical protein ACVWW1_008990 [Bradyrhizobium sp. JR3.5]